MTDDKKRRDLTNKSHCINNRIFKEDLVGIQLRKIRVEINKPFYVGFAVLDLSKLLMYRFHYDVIKKQYGERAQLLFTDTDSLMYAIQTANIYDDMWANKTAYDFSGFPKDSKYYSNDNNKVLGKMKDEAAGKPILEFIGLRPKMYSFMIAQDKLDATKMKEKHVAKGIQRAVIANLRHDDYRTQLDTPAENVQINRRIGTQLHQLYTFATKKRGLCAYDDKRYMVDNVNTLAYGHHRIPVPHIAIDMHPDGPVDAGMIVLPHQVSRRTGKKSSHHHIMKAAEAANAANDGDDAGDNESPDELETRAKRRIRCFSNECEDAEDAIAMVDQYVRLGEPNMVDLDDQPARQRPQEYGDVAEPADFPEDDDELDQPATQDSQQECDMGEPADFPVEDELDSSADERADGRDYVENF